MLAQLTRAERALAQAETMSELLDLRSMAAGMQALAAAQGAAETAQAAKLFQLRIERKAGAWLSQHIKRGRKSDDELTLDQLEIDHNASARWQLIASVPDERFAAWVDERMARGQELTAGGLRMYARHISNGGNPETLHVSASTQLARSSIWLVPPDGRCALEGYRIRCAGPLTGQHIINKSKSRGNDAVRAVLVSCPDELMAQVCYQHNVGRMADTPDAVRILLLQKVYRYGWQHMRDFINALPWKVQPPELTLERLLA